MNPDNRNLSLIYEAAQKQRLISETVEVGQILDGSVEVEEEVLLELLGGLRNIAAAGRDVAKNFGKKVAATATQVGKNAKDIYQTGQRAAETKKSHDNAMKVINKFAEELKRIAAFFDIPYEHIMKRTVAQLLAGNFDVPRPPAGGEGRHITTLQGHVDRANHRAANRRDNGLLGGTASAWKNN